MRSGGLCNHRFQTQAMMFTNTSGCYSRQSFYQDCINGHDRHSIALYESEDDILEQLL